MGIIKPEKNVYIISHASAAGKEEMNGPLGGRFDITSEDGDKFGMPSWEQAEGEMQRLALDACLRKASVSADEIDAVFAGDLMNQCIASSCGLVSFNIPFYGVYGACSTAAEAMSLAAILCQNAGVKKCAAVTSSHNCSAERQFRLPLEYGGQRPPTAQWTVTGAAAFLLTPENPGCKKDEKIPAVTEIMIGKAVDSGISDANNMGAAMAPAAADTLIRYFSESGTKPGDVDLIVTGDLGKEGSSILREFMKSDGYDISDNHTDCGMIIYDIEGQDKHCGGSGCACSGVVMASDILVNVRRGMIKNLLFVGTGALMSPTSVQQGCCISGIGHLVKIEGVE